MKFACILECKPSSGAIIVTYLIQSTNLCTLSVIKWGADNTWSQYNSPCSSLDTFVVGTVRGPGASFLNIQNKAVVRKAKTIQLYFQPEMSIKAVHSCCSIYLLEWKICCRPRVGGNGKDHPPTTRGYSSLEPWLYSPCWACCWAWVPYWRMKGLRARSVISFALKSIGIMNQVMATSKFLCMWMLEHTIKTEPQSLNFHFSFLY